MNNSKIVYHIEFLNVVCNHATDYILHLEHYILIYIIYTYIHTLIKIPLQHENEAKKSSIYSLDLEVQAH